VDDGSEDRTAELAAGHPLGVTVLRQANGGPGAARNAGVRAAQGSLITFLDVDDEWPPGSLLRRVEKLAANPAADIVVGLVRFERLDGSEIPQEPWPAPNLGAGLYRRAVFDKIGFFEPSLLLDDVDWFWRARDAGLVVVNLDEITLQYRRHPRSLTAAKSWLELGLGQVIQRASKRRAGSIAVSGR
jgi:glycosyltransferase involved in cell wall biosynthesis